MRESERIAKCAKLAELSRRNYEFDWRAFTKWCEEAHLTALPALESTVTLFLTHMLAEHRVSTVQRFASAIAHYHRDAGLAKPCNGQVAKLLAGARRERRERPLQKNPLSVEELRLTMRIVRKKRDPWSIRNASILTLGFASALRRSNIVALDVGDVARTAEGLVLWVGREKNHQHGRGREIGVKRGEHRETCPLAALDRWLKLRGTEPGPLYCRIINGRVRPDLRLHPCNVAKAVKAAAELAGLDPARYGGHSLRAGFVTAGVLGGLSDLAIARQTGHRSLESLRAYFRAADLWRANPSGLIGL